MRALVLEVYLLQRNCGTPL